MSGIQTGTKRAVAKGLLAAVKQGRIARWIVDAYASNHP